MTATYVNWGNSRIRMDWQAAKELPEYKLITSVHGLCFLEGKLLIVKLKHRGWDLPGGHMEPDEFPEACFKREAMEEGYAEGECELLGYVIVGHSENLEWSESSPYPKLGFQVFYRMDIKKMHNFEGEFESEERMLIDPNKVPEYFEGWHAVLAEVLKYALRNT
ncbi:NUDIX hydrolase [Bacillus sp. J33]|uniref:NUDIX hydrolase n=1 Tax=Bacillus sp. J33 TaxID=935836 RepID=UPI00047C3DFF|nr:NUDIX domain-containing protein [Bacillus sp. J33]